MTEGELRLKITEIEEREEKRFKFGDCFDVD